MTMIALLLNANGLDLVLKADESVKIYKAILVAKGFT
jgi:hypothetical protein